MLTEARLRDESSSKLITNTVAIRREHGDVPGNYKYDVLTDDSEAQLAFFWCTMTGGRDVIVTESLQIVLDTLGVGELWRAEQAERHVSAQEKYEAISSLLEILRALSRG
jgi:hypothetical protein